MICKNDGLTKKITKVHKRLFLDLCIKQYHVTLTCQKGKLPNSTHVISIHGRFKSQLKLKNTLIEI